MKKWILLYVLLYLTGCASVPLMTKIKMATYGESDFLDINPTELRIKAKINQHLEVDLSKATQVTLALNTESGIVQLPLLLEIIEIQIEPATQGLFSNSPPFEISTMKLSPDGIEKFTLLQQALKDKKFEGGSFSAGLTLSEENAVPIDETILFSVAVALTHEENYLTLVDDLNFTDMLEKQRQP